MTRGMTLSIMVSHSTNARTLAFITKMQLSSSGKKIVNANIHVKCLTKLIHNINPIKVIRFIVKLLVQVLVLTWSYHGMVAFLVNTGTGVDTKYNQTDIR